MKNKSIIAGAGIEGFLDHRAPLSGLDQLLPASVGDAPSVDAITPITSQDLMAKMARKGARMSDVRLPVYRAASEGRPRALDNKDAVLGYEPLYSGLSHLESVHKALSKDVIPSLRRLFPDDGNLMNSGENQDLNKITMQRWKPPGWFLHQPFSDELKMDAYAPIFVQALKAVISRYVSVLKPDPIWAKARTSWMSLILDDFDPNDTSTGLPTLSSGTQTHLGRLAILRALPNPATMDPMSWLASFSGLGRSLGMPDYFAYSSVLATRHGPTRKPISLWVKDAVGYSATYSSVGVYDRTRFVYPVSYPLNFVLSPVYLMLKTARQKITGLWHDPASMSQYIQKFKKYKNPYSVDFSGMDTTMPPHLIKLINVLLIDAGFPAWPLHMLSAAYETMGIVTPSYMGDTGSTSVISGTISWMSGFKLTSEYDTLYGAATLLSALETMHPGTISKWNSGEWTFAELGDDICFTWPTSLDTAQLASLAKSIAGADLKVLEDAMFLKRMLPIHPDVPHLTRTFARVIQQTFFNEDKYTGEGGVRPDAVMRVGMIARLETLDAHPKFRDAWSILLPVIRELGYISRSDATFLDQLSRGKPQLMKGDIEAIKLFAMRNTSYMDSLASRARFEPSAAALFETFTKLGITNGVNPDLLTVRKLYMDALLAKPSSKDVNSLREACTWLR